MSSTAKEHFEYTYNEWKTPYFHQILEKLEKIDVVYDIGANAGGFTAVLKEMFPHAYFYCVEPLSENFNQLVTVTGVACRKTGIYYGKDKAKLQWRGSNIGAIFVEDVDAGEPRIDIGEITDLVTLENLNFPKPSLVKLDVEGAEVNIVENSTLLKTTPWIIVEWHPDHIDPISFFERHLPNHKIIINLENKQFLLKYENINNNA